MKNLEMNVNERMDALINYKPMDRIPVIILGGTYSVSWTNYSLKDFFYNPKLAYDIQEKVIKIHGYDGSPGYGFPNSIATDLGGELVFSNKPLLLPTLKKRICNTIGDVEKLKMPDLSDKNKLPLSVKLEMEFNRIKIARGEKISIMPASPTEHSANIVGIENLMKWCIKSPETVHRIQRLVTDYLLAIADLIIDEFGLENCTLFEPFPMECQNLISSKTFEKFCLPYIVEINEKMMKKGINGWFIHLCGNHMGNLKYWKNEIKIPKRTIISVGDENDIEKAAKYFGRDYVIAGNLSTALLKTATYKEVYEESRKIIEKMKYNEGGFIFMPACGIAENTPHLNVQAMVEAAKTFGKF